MKKINLRFLVFIVSGSILSSSFIYPVSSDRVYTFEYEFKQPIIKHINDSILLQIPHSNVYLIRPGYPMLPCWIKTFYLPINSKITYLDVTSKGIYSMILDEKLFPSPTPSIIGEKLNYRDIRYNFSVYPNSWFSYHLNSGIHNGRRYKILTILVYPIKYYPYENTVSILKSVKINFNYTINSIKRDSNNEEFKLVVISPNRFHSLSEEFVEYKNQRMIPTKLVTLDEIYNGIYFPVQGRDNPEKIKYFIKNAIENWNTSFILLVGGIKYTPSREVHIKITSSGDREIFYSDLYYADLYDANGNFSSWDSNNNSVFAEYNWDGNTDILDLYPDVYLSRIPCNDEVELENILDKIRYYEENRSYNDKWFRNIITIGGDTFIGDDFNEGEIANEEAIELLGDFTSNKIWVSNGRLNGSSGVSEIQKALDEGSGFIYLSGHGSTDKYATHPHNNSTWIPTPTRGLYSNQLIDFHNKDRYPIMITTGCSNSRYDKDSKCFSWSFLINPDGGGIASIGATALGYAHGGIDIIRDLIDGIALNTFKAYRNGAKTFGELWVEGVNLYLEKSLEAVDYKTILEWQPFGDPTLAIAEGSNPPWKPIINGPTQGKLGEEYTFNATASDPDGDKIYYMFDWGDGSYSKILGPFNSNETISITHKWMKRGVYNIRVRVKDIYGSISSWSDPITFNIKRCSLSIKSIIKSMKAIIINIMK